MDQANRKKKIVEPKRLLALLAIAGLTAGIAACGDAATGGSSDARTTTSTSSSTTDYAKADADRDNDIGASHDDTNHNDLSSFGRPAGAGDERAIATVVKRYYATALNGDGAKGCSMLYSILAETAAEDYAVAGGPTYLRGATSCQAVMSALFSHFHAQLAIEVPKFGVTHVFLKGRHGLVVLSFADLPERELPVIREGNVWKIASLLDRELP
jgi:hypothetical protein